VKVVLFSSMWSPSPMLNVISFFNDLVCYPGFEVAAKSAVSLRGAGHLSKFSLHSFTSRESGIAGSPISFRFHIYIWSAQGACNLVEVAPALAAVCKIYRFRLGPSA
jgi:hypothetical protein